MDLDFLESAECSCIFSLAKKSSSLIDCGSHLVRPPILIGLGNLLSATHRQIVDSEQFNNSARFSTVYSRSFMAHVLHISRHEAILSWAIGAEQLVGF